MKNWKIIIWLFITTVIGVVTFFGLEHMTGWNWGASLTIAVFVSLLLLWIVNPDNLTTKFFGRDNKERTHAKVLKYIGVICGSIILLANLHALTTANQLGVDTNTISKKGQLDTRFKDAAILLGSDNTTTTIAGIYALHQVATEASQINEQRHYVNVIHDIFRAYLDDNLHLVMDVGATLTIPKGHSILAQIIIECLRDTSVLYKPNLNYLDLREINFNRINLNGADLTGVVLVGVDLREADLNEANLNEANLVGATLVRADLTGATLVRADLTGANLSEANLSEADLSGADLSGADLSGADLSGADLQKSYFISRTKITCYYENTELPYEITPVVETSDTVDSLTTVLIDTSLEGAKLDLASLENTHISILFASNITTIAISKHPLSYKFNEEELENHFVFRHNDLPNTYLVAKVFRGANIEIEDVYYTMPIE